MICLALLGLAIIAGVVGMQSTNGGNYGKGSGDDDDSSAQNDRISDLQITDNTIDYVGLVLWPVIWELTIGSQVLQLFPFTFIGLIWPMILMFWDLHTSGSRRTRLTTDQIETNLAEHTSIDVSAVVAITFTMSGLLLSGDSTTASISAPMLMFALLFAITFVVPTQNVHAEGETKYVISSLQRVFLHFSIGFVISGIAVNLSSIHKQAGFFSYRQKVRSSKRIRHANEAARQMHVPPESYSTAAL